MHDEHKSGPQADQAWFEQQIRESVKSIAPVRSSSELQQIFMVRFTQWHVSRRRRKQLSVGTGASAAAGVAADSYFGIEWLEMIGALIQWVGRSMTMVASSWMG
jgi:hypothetical protein